jgi:hypothetical protein
MMQRVVVSDRQGEKGGVKDDESFGRIAKLFCLACCSQLFKESRSWHKKVGWKGMQDGEQANV